MNPTGKIGFENGTPVAVTEFDFSAVDRDNGDIIRDYTRGIAHETQHRLLDLLLDGNADVKTTGIRAHLIAFGLGIHPAKTQRELAAYLKTSEGNLSKWKARNCKRSNVFLTFFKGLGKVSGQ